MGRNNADFSTAMTQGMSPWTATLYRGTSAGDDGKPIRHEIGDEIVPHKDSVRGLVFATNDIRLARHYANIGNVQKFDNPFQGHVYALEPIDPQDVQKGSGDVEFTSKRGFRVVGKIH